tara:strand:+ start:253 stop:441 length:189 start_codon:yes stop_codon:yes gene_type:complete
MPNKKLKKDKPSTKKEEEKGKDKRGLMPKEVKKAETHDDLKAKYEKRKRVEKASKIKVKKII